MRRTRSVGITWGLVPLAVVVGWTAVLPTAAANGASTAASVAAVIPSPPRVELGIRATGPVVSPTLFGMQYVGLTATPLSPTQAAGLGPRAGTGSVNLLQSGAEWALAQPVRGRAPNFTALEAAVTNARSRGVTALSAQIFGVPAWAAASPPLRTPRAGLPDGWTAVPQRDAWRAYIRAMVTRFKGRIGAYVVWPEANLSDLWGGTPAQLADLTKDAYTVIKSVDPRALVVSASTTVRLLGWRTWYASYLRELARRGWPTDVYSFHGYTESTGTPVTRQRYITEFKALLAAARAPRRQIWDGEVSWGIAGPGPRYRHVRMDRDWRAAAYVSRTVLDSLRLGVSRVSWSVWAPASPAGTGYGITLHPGTRGAKGLKTTYDWLVGKRWLGCSYSAGLVTCQVAAGSRVSRILWSETTPKTVRVPRGVTRRCTVEGACASTRANSRLVVTGSPVWLGR